MRLNHRSRHIFLDKNFCYLKKYNIYIIYMRTKLGYSKTRSKGKFAYKMRGGGGGGARWSSLRKPGRPTRGMRFRPPRQGRRTLAQRREQSRTDLLLPSRTRRREPVEEQKIKHSPNPPGSRWGKTFSVLDEGAGGRRGHKRKRTRRRTRKMFKEKRDRKL
jgi:hypothetical protein